MQNFYIYVAVVALSGCASLSQPRCTIEKYGLAGRGQFLSNERTDSAATGQIRRMDSLVILRETDRISARLGTTFGVQFLFENVPISGQIEQEIAHPPMRSREGRLRTSTVYRTSGSSRGSTYTFDTPEELLPGVWVFISRYEGQELCRKTFTVEAG
jgi:Domain of unknown function (DUF3859)